MNAILEKIKAEPARVVAAVVAVIGVLSAFGLGISNDQSAAIVAAVGALLALVSGEAVRAQVTPTSKLDAEVQ